MKSTSLRKATVSDVASWINDITTSQAMKKEKPPGFFTLREIFEKLKAKGEDISFHALQKEMRSRAKDGRSQSAGFVHNGKACVIYGPPENKSKR